MKGIFFSCWLLLFCLLPLEATTPEGRKYEDWEHERRRLDALKILQEQAGREIAQGLARLAQDTRMEAALYFQSLPAEPVIRVIFTDQEPAPQLIYSGEKLSEVLIPLPLSELSKMQRQIELLYGRRPLQNPQEDARRVSFFLISRAAGLLERAHWMHRSRLGNYVHIESGYHESTSSRISDSLFA